MPGRAQPLQGSNGPTPAPAGSVKQAAKSGACRAKSGGFWKPGRFCWEGNVAVAAEATVREARAGGSWTKLALGSQTWAQDSSLRANKQQQANLPSSRLHGRKGQ